MAITEDQYSLLIAAPMLQDYLVDKDTAEALSGGIMTFYRDNDRDQLKNVYMQSGSPGNYTYIPLPNPLTLSGVGTIADNGGNDVIPFFFPYNEDDTDEVETYYITVYSVNENGDPAVLQFTRENFPFVPTKTTPDTSQQSLINLIPNGQFAAHTDLPNSGVYPNGTTDVVVAQGGSAGWYYTKDNGSTDVDHITFAQILQEPDDLNGNPRYAINIDCTSATGSDTFKELRMRFNNVNRFASDTQFYTYSFSGKSNSASSVEVFLKVIKYFGTGGSATTETTIQGFTLESGEFSQYNISFIFGTNEAATIGSDDTDYIELALVMPATSTFDVEMTNFILTPGFLTLNDYPERPDNMVFANGVAGSMPTPNPDGSDLYLPLVITRAGVIADSSVIGSIWGFIAPTVTGPFLACDGSTYLTSDYSDLGIPYSRLQTYLANVLPATNGIPMYGTGSTFATGYIIDGITDSIRLSTNQAGVQTAAADGVIATGFTFAVIHTGQTIALKAYSRGTASLVGIANAVGAVTAASAGTSGFSVAETVNVSGAFSEFTVGTLAASGMVAGSYFTFSVPGTNFYCWFRINGAGADPAPGGTGIRVDLLSTFTAAEVAACVRESISGFQVNRIITVAASSITPGAYFTFSANSVSYSVWYQKDGSGTAPGVGTPIQVSIGAADTAADIATKTIEAINSYSFGAPDFRGMYLRGLKGTGQFDTGATTRFSVISGVFGNNSGTFEMDTFQSHNHPVTVLSAALPGVTPAIDTVSVNTIGPAFNPQNISIGNRGSGETTPVNAAVNWFIRY